MGRVSRPRPQKLPLKLRQIRDNLGLSQSQMLKALGLEENHYSSAISGYEIGTQEPSLLTILAYAKLTGISTDVLIDDERELPKKLKNKKSF